MQSEMGKEMKEEIMDRIAEAVREKMGTEYDISFRKSRKNNGLTLQGINIRKHGEMVSPVIYIDNLLEGIMQHGTDIQDAADKILRIYTRSRDDGKLADAARSLDKEAILERTVYRLVGKKRNMDMLADVLYKELLDLAVIYVAVLDEDEDGTTGFMLTDYICRYYGINREELDRAARRNTETGGFRTVPMSSIIEEWTGIPKDEIAKNTIPMYICSNIARHFGAAIMLYKGYMDRLACKLGSDLYILPSSVHEVIAVPAGRYSPRELRDMVREINAGGSISEDEILSNSVYFYSLKKGELRIA